MVTERSGAGPVLYRLLALKDQVPRAVGSIKRRRRCDVCRSRMSTKTYGRATEHHPALQGLYGTLTAKRGPYRAYAHYLCDECQRRNEKAAAEFKANRADELTRMVERCRAWLREAPLLDRLPDPVSSFADEPGPFRRFVEVMEFDTAADQCAQSLLNGRSSFLLGHGFYPRPLPEAYHDVLELWQSDDAIHSTRWTGSIYRQNDGRVVLHWHTWKFFHLD